MPGKTYFETYEAVNLLNQLRRRPENKPAEPAELQQIVEGLRRPPKAAVETGPLSPPVEPSSVPAVSADAAVLPEIEPEVVANPSAEPHIEPPVESVVEFFHRILKR